MKLSDGRRYIHTVEIQQQDESIDSTGFPQTDVWETLVVDGTTMDEVPAEVLTGPGRGYLASSQEQAEVAARITLPWFHGLKASHRIIWDDRVFRIIGEPEMDRTGRLEWRVKCSSNSNDQAP